MTSQELRDTLGALGLSQAGGARLLGVDGRTMRRWIAEDGPGAREVPPPVARFLRYLVAAQVTPEAVLQALGEVDAPPAP